MSAIFKVECDATKHGETVFVVGDLEVLGNWKPHKAKPLATSDKEFPRWTSQEVKLPGEQFQFKLLIMRGNGQSVRWEQSDNRLITVPSGANFTIFCSWNRQQSDLKITASSTSEAEVIVQSSNLAGLSVKPREVQASASRGVSQAKAAVQNTALATVPVKPREMQAAGARRDDSATSASLGLSQADFAAHYGLVAAGLTAPGDAPPAPRLRLKLPDGLGADRVVACGGAPALGSWDPAAAPALESEGCGSGWRLQQAPDGVASGAEFKYVVWTGGRARWEDSRQNRLWPKGDSEVTPPVHYFNQASPRRAAGEDLVIDWGGPGTIEGGCGPGAIFHAFNWQFREVARRAAEIAALGFDAVQLSPAQRSANGDQWYMRYQPLKYEEIHGLGGENELREACSACARVGLQVLGDLVFNHMKVVASCHEWRRSEHDHALREFLKGRLDNEFGPTFNRDDFQWPWFELQGAEWDGPMRMEGWGCGEWSELRGGSPKVVAAHRQHLEKLRACGVDGFRLDAAKHMRPQHVANYASIASSLPPAPARGSKAAATFVFGEVLSIDPEMHKEYQQAQPPQGVEALPDGPLSTTDFFVALWLRCFLEGGEEHVDFALEDWVRHLLEVEQGHAGSRPPQRLHKGQCTLLSVPLAGRNSVRFARNHDTVCNDARFYGLGHWSGLSAVVASAWLLAVHDGSVILLADDVKAWPLVQDALLFRRALRKRVSSSRAPARTEICALRDNGSGPPLLVCIACRLGESCAGFCLLGGVHGGAPVEFRGAALLTGGAGPAKFFAAPGCGDGSVTVGPGGTLSEAVLLRSGEGAFFLAAES